MKLLFTLKNKRRKTNLKFDFKKYHCGPPKKGAFVFKENPPKKLSFTFWLWFSFKNDWHINVLMVCIFENALKKQGWALRSFPFGMLPFFSVLKKERSVLFYSFLEFLLHMRPKRTFRSFPFFSKERKRTQRTFCSF